jgi:ATP-dependent Clp protease ATP-binding subunit ClpC
MPKINVYVPDELAEAIKEAGIPVSAVCQRALETAVRRVTAIREAVISPTARLENQPSGMAHFTERARTVVKLAVKETRTQSAAEVGTEHLLAGLLAEGGNLALQVLRAIEIEPSQVRRELDRHFASGPAPATSPTASPADPAQAAASSASSSPPPDAASAGLPAPDGDLRFSSQAAAALELAVTEAISFSHNYVGCEHLLLGLIAEPDGAGGRILRSLGAEMRLTRRAVGAAIAGYVHLRAQQGQGQAAGPTLTDPMTKLSSMIDEQLKPVVERLNRIEGNLGL